EGLAVIEPPADDLLALDEAIEALRAMDPRLAEIVHLRYYAGLTVEETAAVVGGSDSTVKRDWRFTRAWLARRLGQRGAAGGAAPRPRAAGRALPDPAPHRRGGHGRRLRGGAGQPAPPRRSQGRPPRPRLRRPPQALHARGPDPGAAAPPRHRPGLRGRPG